MRRRPKQRYNALRKTSKERGFELALSFDEYKEIAVGKCVYCRGPLPQAGHGLDRKDSKKGYTRENVVPCCKSCNSIKSDILTYSEMMFVMGQLRRLRAGKPNRT